MMKFQIAGALCTLMIAGGSYAYAQTANRQNADALESELKNRALTRAAVDPAPVGEAAKETVESAVNWIEMRTALALTARREVAAQQTATRAVSRPPGMRAAPAETFKSVVVREVNLTRLPLLAPEGPRVAGTLKVYSLGDSYSATAEVEDGVSMRMSGSRRKIVVGERPAALARMRAMRAQEKPLASLETPYVVTRSDSSTDLSFSKFGAGYVLSLMCDDPADARCADDAFIVGLASNIMLLNPEAGGQ
ncbi:MAG: hypothetical protein HXY21_08310 [Parvularculaceae bacterium]|nr:hypothetical protein [Parvularculaceae bacterium]